jgi:photosystem II stability/assembly factor-like uncharacterized protein
MRLFNAVFHRGPRLPRAAAALLLMSMLAAAASGQTRTRQLPSRAQQPRPTSAAPAGQYKGIWEPVNYKEDLQLLDVFFATVDEGWVSGKSGTILHTVDGGKSWTAELGGDPQSADAQIEMFRFLDQRHGWAVQNHKLLKTSDGQDWEEAGTIVQNMRDYRFISPQIGVALGGGGMSSEKIYRTVDGGRNWKEVFECATKLEIEGLTKQVGCWFLQLHFTSSRVGYAVGGHPMCGNCGGPPLIAKTEDGGMSWRILVGPGDIATSTLDAVFFVDDQNGFVRVSQGQKLFVTNDGGQTWHGVVASPAKEIRFADPEVGWSFDSRTLSYTVDGGKHWLSREFRFPADTYGFSLPRRDRGYIVGDHGMIYRYRLVPIEYTAKGMIPAPLLSGIDSPLDVYVQQLVAQVNKISADAGLPPVNTAAPGTVPTQSAVAGGGFTQNTDPNVAATAPDAAAGGFTQNTDPNASAATAGAGGFSQDVGQAQTTLYSVSSETPKFTSKYRNLNLLLAGLQMASQMTAQVQALQQSLQSLKNAKDPRSAAPSITNVQTSVAGLLQLVQNAYQKPR